MLGYAVLPRPATTQAAVPPPSAPAPPAFGGVVLLDEALSLPLLAAATPFLGGIALVTTRGYSEASHSRR